MQAKNLKRDRDDARMQAETLAKELEKVLTTREQALYNCKVGSQGRSLALGPKKEISMQSCTAWVAHQWQAASVIFQTAPLMVCRRNAARPSMG